MGVDQTWIQSPPDELHQLYDTLIDGGKLVDLLIEHELGVRKKSIEILELDEKWVLTLEMVTA